MVLYRKIFQKIPDEPSWITGQYTHDQIEPFAGLFYWLAKYGKPYFLKASILWDNVSTKVTGAIDENITYCLHSWYSRDYDINYREKVRIDFLYEVAKLNKAGFFC
ncbi:hypothetical protein [Chitinophaga sp. LS1]|uniref:hypothetical protein n=1 Tax=Chitinophaga sp. LS1 TaxID=3051176 RepID=UPI002AAB463A|nr:hypothetical protein [Chitinophaga sp. LS1]WPV67748.1 hypothetical protein QQL36_03280 [Chitinophaga sp. LS1]